MSKRKASPLAGMNIAITGTLSVSRAQFEATIVENGGTVAKSVTNTCTHLVSAETGTKKCQDAEAKGVMIVDEAWVRAKIDGGDGGAASTPAAPPAPAAKKTKAAATPATAPAPAPALSDDGIFSGINFNVAGTADFKGPLEEMIVSNGGKLVSITEGCNYLVCPDDSMGKLRAIAAAKMIQLVNDQWLVDAVVSGVPLGSGSASSSSSSKPSAAPVVAKAKAVSVPVAAKPAAVATTTGLNGLTFAITGTLSVGRAEFEAMIVKHGGAVAKSVTNSVTHLVSAETGTKKCQDAEAKGVTIVNEDWVRQRIGGGGGSAEVAKPAGKKGGKKAADPEPEDEEEEDNDDEDEDNEGGSALSEYTFAITGTLSVSRAEFEAFIIKNGGKVAKSVTNSVTHLVSSETGTKKCQDAEAKGVLIVDEQWVRDRVSMLSGDNDDEADSGEMSFKPKHTFVKELISTDEDEGRCEYQGGKKNVGKIIWNRDDNDSWEDAPKFKVVSFKGKDGEGTYTIKEVDDPSNTLEIDEDEICDSYFTVPPLHVQNRWSRYQNKQISEGVWMEKADDSMMSEINRLVDEFAAKEPADFHPGTNGIVRDLVHPSLYPHILDPSTIDTNTRNHWYRPYEQSRFQWLPAEVTVDQSGTAKFVSPINNLDSTKYPDLQTGLEKVLTKLIPGMEKVWEYGQICKVTEGDDGEWPDSYEEVAPVSFKNSKLQVVAKIADYCFEPGATFSGVWHYEGMAHENIVMTGLFYPSSDSRLGGGLEFKRQYTDVEAGELLYGVCQSRPIWLDNVIQEGFVPLGKTTTETGKLMVFPNCHAHRVLEMVNKTNETLRRRLIVFFVVDPNRRIPSSADHPPLPRKITLEQALADRLELMQERKQAKQALNPREIELCEH